MFEELCQLLQGAPKKKLSQTDVGKSLDLLRQLGYFDELNSKFGADYLVLLLPTLQPFILREGFLLIDQCDLYLLVEGILNEQQPLFQASRPIVEGKVLDLKEKDGVRFLAKSDCKMIRIKKGPSIGFQLEKKLILLEKERKRSLLQMQAALKGQSYKQKYEFLHNISYFSSLGQFDFLDLANKSHMHEYNQGNSTHKEGEIISKIGCILGGRIKLSYPIKKDQAYRQKGIVLHRCEGDWLGLEQFLWNQQFRTSGEVSSIVAMVVWIPREVFQSKFSLKTNYLLVSRLKGLIQAKKALLERGLKCRRAKLLDMEQQIQTEKTVNSKLVEKISAFQVLSERKHSNFRRTKNYKDIQIPQLIMHRMNINLDPVDIETLPKIDEKLNLFPEAFKNVPISQTQLKEMQRLERNKNRHLEPRRSRTFLQKNPQQLYQTILQKIPRKFKASSSEFLKTYRQEKPSIHYNMSIYNNFRVGKQKALQPNNQKLKTLNLLPKNDHKY